MSIRHLAAAVFATFLVATACAPSAPQGGGAPAGKPTYGGTVTFALENDITDLDPMRSRLFVDRNIHYQIYDSLVRINAKGEIIPWLAEKWTTAEDGKSVTFNLRKDVKYHDGTPFDGESVKWNIDRYRLTKESARAGELAPVDSVTVVDPFTVRFALKAPFAPLIAQLVDRAGMMLSRKAVEAGGEDFTRKAFRAGTGPFVLTEAVKDDHYTLERNADWWGKGADESKLPYLDKIVIKPILDGDVRLTNVRTGDAQVANNITGKDVPTVKADPGLVYQQVAALAFDSLIPNRTKGFVFEDRRYVKAVSMALDRTEILEKGPRQGVGSVGYGPIAPSHFAFDANFKPFPKADPDGAKKLVAEVGKGPLKFELLVSSGNPAELQLAQLIQAQLAKADITAEIKTLLFNEIVKLQTDGKYSGMTQISWSGRIDPDGNVYDHVYSGRPFNNSFYSNKEVDRFLDDQRTTSDQAKRRDLLRRAEQIFVADDPARVWYGFRVAQLLTVKNLKGLEPYPDAIVRFQFGWLQK